ncbi:UBP28 hydrolase, partial [Ardeotis kori]|nr:UBP28 hydrolase [Ardeotis kori]
DCQMLLNQLKEITGIQDSAFLHAALKAANGDLMEAVTFLTEEHAQEPAQDAAAAEPSAWEGSAVGKQLPPSKSFVSAHPYRFPSCIFCDRPQEPRSAESKNRPKRKRCDVWGENPKLNDWRRVGDWPVGMKNIGNTCWFSAVIQSLFQLPEFRRLVLGYSLPQNVLESCRSRTGKRNIAFMQELQCLFALMLGTRRKFVDPSAALELLRDAFRSAEEQQQDVSEFTHKLLDWLEDAFQLAVNVKSPGDKSENPMVQLFYGTFLTEGVHEGNTFSKIETFGQYPLQVNGYRNLSECLEGAMVEGELDEATASRSVKYGQERWFTKLPPVLTFELSRFEFNQSLGQPEKIHTKLEFPQTIYMDRYLYCSKELIQMKREEMKRLKEKMVILQQKLERYMKYGSGPARFPLPDMLQYVLEFAATKPAVGVCSAGGSRAAPLPSRAEPPALDRLSQPNGVLERKDARTEDAAVFSANPSPQQQSSAPLQPSGSPAGTSECPAPHAVSEEELNLVRTCLQRWRDEIEQDVQDLKESITRISLSIEQMYCDPLLQQVPYRLHAVLVHEGQANAGHYWAYIYDQPRKSWLKYNDISVTESSWEELERDSFGGLRNASAYCLMYISEQVSRFTADRDEGAEAGQFQKEVEALSPELRHYIQEDNWRLEQEAEEWEEEQSCKIPQMEPSPASESQDLSSESGPDQSSVCEQSVRSLSSEHAMIAKEQTAKAIANTADAYEKNGVEAALCEVGAERRPGKQPLLLLALLLLRDFAFSDSVEFCSCATSDPQVVERTLLEQFADKNLSYDESRSISIMKVARAKLREIGPDEVDMEEYKRWHEDYSLFRKVSVYLLTGLELYQNRKWLCGSACHRFFCCQAPVLNLSCLELDVTRGVNTHVGDLETRKDFSRAMFSPLKDGAVLWQVCNLKSDFPSPEYKPAFRHYSRMETELNSAEVSRALCRPLSSRCGAADCLVLSPLPATLQVKLGELLPRLLDCSTEVIVLKEPPKIRPNSPYDLCSRFAAVMESIHGASAVAVK